MKNKDGSIAKWKLSTGAATTLLKAILFNGTRYMGMLRGIDEHEIVATISVAL